MSLASATGQVIFSQKGGVYMPAIQCNQGDLYQEYMGEASAPTNIAPDFASLKPVLSFILTSSRVAEGLVVPSSMTTDYYGLQIVKNLVKASGAASCTIKGEATVTVGNTSDTVQFVYSIPITKGVGNQKHVTIIAGDNKYFTLRDKGQSCILKAVARMGSDEITTGLAYKWYNQVNGAWSVLSGKTTQTLTVTNDMVDTTGVFKAEVYQGGKLIGQDTQSVMDASDPFDLILNPTPEDETIRESGDTVVYKPILVKRGSTTKYKDMTFYFVFMDSAGVVLNPSTSGTAATSGTCTWDMCQQAGGNVAWTITTKE